jgi:hypothetical protein
MEPLLRSEDNQLDLEDSRYFDALFKEAHTSWKQIIADANVAPLITALKSADSAFADDEKFVSNYLSLRQNPSRFNPAAFEAIDSFRGTKGLKRFDIFAKAYQLLKVWKLDPVLMRDLNDNYGPIDFSDPNKHLPLDWRHPDSHAIYWAVKGLQVTAQEESRQIGMTETNTDRIAAHSLQNLFRNGKMFIYDVPLEATSQESSQQRETQVFKEVFLRPDLRMFEPYNKSVLAILEKYNEDKGSYESLQNGHRNMLKNAVLSFYQAGHIRRAQEIYNEMRRLYPLDEFKVAVVDDYVSKRFREELQNIGLNDAKEMVVMMLRESYFRYAIRDDDEAFGREKLATEVWNLYQTRYEDENRIDLPDFKLLRYFALLDFLNDEQYPPNLRGNLLGRIKIERPELFKQLETEEEKLRKQLEQPE